MELDEITKKKHKEWLQNALKKHEDRVLKVAKTYESFLDNDLPAQTDDRFQSQFNHYFINLRKQIPELIGDMQIRIKPSMGKETIELEADASGVPQTFDNKKACIIANNQVGNLFAKMEVKYDIKACIHDLKVANLTAVLVGNDTQVNEAKAVPDSMNNLMGEKAQNGELIPGEVAQPVNQVQSLGKNEVVIKRVSYKDCMFDPDSVEYFFNDKGYAIRKVKLTKEKALSIDPNLNTKDGWETDSKDNEKNDSAKKWSMYEIYDYTGDKVVRTRYMGKCAKFIDQNEFDYDPLLGCKLNFLPDTAYPKGDMPYYRSAVDESNFYRTVVMNNLDKAVPKVFVKKDAIDSENADKMVSPIAFEKIDVDTKGLSLDGVVKVEGFNTNDNDMQVAIDRATSDIHDISQVNDERFKPSNAPATNATISNNAFQSGIEEQKSILKDFVRNIVKSVVAVLKEISVESQTFTFEQPNGVRETITWNNKDIQYIDFEVDVDIDPAVPGDIKLARIRDYANWITQPNIYMGLNAEGKKLNFTELVKQVGGYLMPDGNVEKLIIDSNQLTPEKEDLLMMQGQPVEPQEGEDHNKHLEDHKALLLNHPLMQTLPPEILQIFDKHIVGTINMLAQKESLMKQKSNPMEKAGANPTVAGNITAGALNVA